MTKEEIQKQLETLGPWHMDIHLTDELSTASGNKKNYANEDHTDIFVVDPLKLKKMFSRIYDNKLKGKTFLDVGCNSGGYCFLANELGAERVYGFDVRNHWIDQAKLVQKIKNLPSDKINFDTHHIDDLNNKKDKYDITLFKGVFYHLPNPISAVETLAKVTNEIMIINTGCRLDIPENCMIPKVESKTHVMSGVDGLSWYPGGPGAVHAICAQYGFGFSKVISFDKEKFKRDNRVSSKRNVGRFTTIVAKKEEYLKNL